MAVASRSGWTSGSFRPGSPGRTSSRASSGPSVPRRSWSARTAWDRGRCRRCAAAFRRWSAGSCASSRCCFQRHPPSPTFRCSWPRIPGSIFEAGSPKKDWTASNGVSPGRSLSRRPALLRLRSLPVSTTSPSPRSETSSRAATKSFRKLQDGAATAITQAETIHGLGGIGKTRLAVEHAWRSGHLYDSAFFVVAESPEALRSNLANLARPDLLNLPEYKAAAQEESVAAVLRWLREHDRWLLILDNVDTKEAEQAVVKIVPSLSAGRVLITSRIRDWPATIRRQPIETLSLDEAQRFILDRTANDRAPSDDDPDQALRLAEELGGLPLALEQAAAYIAQHQMSLSEYLEEWEKEREKVLNWYDGSVMQYPAPVAVTWQKTFQQLRPTAAAILRLTAYLAPDPIPSKMFEDGAEIVGEAVGMLCEEMEAQVEDGSVKEAITELASYSMVTRKGESFTVHRMVQDALRSRIPEERRRDWIERSLRLVNDFSPVPPDDVRTWPTWDLLRPHAARVIQNAEENGIFRPNGPAHAANWLCCFRGKGLYREAEPLIRRALQIDEDSLGPQHPNVAIRPQQPGVVASGHEPLVGGRAPDAARPPDRRRLLRTSTPQRRHPTSTTWRRCFRPRTAWRRPSP